MKTQLYIIYDNKAQEAHGDIIAFNHDAAAIRFFGDVASNEKTTVSKHPRDFELRHIGRFDSETCTIEPNASDSGYGLTITGEQWLAAQQKENE